MDSSGGSWQGDPSDQQDHQHSVREGGCEVNYLHGGVAFSITLVFTRLMMLPSPVVFRLKVALVDFLVAV